MKHLIVTLLATICLAATTANAQTGATYKFTPNHPYSYRTEGTTDIAMEMQGTPFTVTSKNSYYSIFTVDRPIENGRMHCTLKFSDVKITVETPMGTQNAGKELEEISTGFTIDQNGALISRDTVATSTTMQLAQQVQSALRMFPVLKPEHLRKGARWEEQYRDTIKIGEHKVISTTTHHYAVVGEEVVNNRPCLSISDEGAVEVAGQMEQSGATIDLSGTSKTKGTLYFCVEDGLLLKHVAIFDGTQEVKNASPDGSDMSMSITGSQTSVLTTN
jgi:hypothetical protein